MSDIDDLQQRRATLSAEKRALLAKWTRSGSDRRLPASAPVIPRYTRQGPMPLSFAQQRLWFIDQLVPGNPAYNIASALCLSGPLQVAVLARSLQGLVQRHASLRTLFVTLSGQAQQHILPVLQMPLPVIDLRHLPAQRQTLVAQHLAHAHASGPFSLARGPLLRVHLLRLGAQEHILLLTLHHIIADGWSLGIIERELAVLYTALLAGQPSPLPELAIQYSDFALWQQSWLQGEVLERQLAYWQEQLAAAPTLLALPTDFPRPATQSFCGEQLLFTLSSELADGLHALCQQQHTTLFMLLLAAWQTLLYRYSGQSEILVGTPVANRRLPEVEQLVGMFVNTLVLRASLAGNPPFLQLLAQIQRRTLQAYDHQDLPFERLVDALQPARELSHSPLFQVMLTFVETSTQRARLPGLSTRPFEAHGGTALFDLWLTIIQQHPSAEDQPGGVLSGILEYRSDLFTHASMQRLLTHFQVLLTSIVADPRQRVDDLRLLSPDEAEQLVRWNHTAVPYDLRLCLHEQIEAQVARTPDAIALILLDDQLTYRVLNEQANRLARLLRRRGVGSETVVGVAMQRSTTLLITLLAILKAGGTYLPLDPTYPQERLSLMLADAQAPLLLTGPHLRAHLPRQSAQVLCPDDEQDTLAQEESDNLPRCSVPDNSAYLIYTSGSTGTPKGVLVPHRGICNRLLWMQDAYRLSSRDAVLQKTPVSFDVSVWELFWPLLAGAHLVMAEPEGHRDSAYLVHLIASQAISVIHFVPSLLRVFLEEPELAACTSLRAIICSGEALSFELQERCLARLPAELHNLYGPTEASVDVTSWACQRESDLRCVPIGRPIANTRIFVLDRALHPVPPGVPAELYIGGTGLARGYLHRPQLSAARFVPDPSGLFPGARLYRTGDLARFLPGGAIEFLGRVDDQVKLRGLRIEPGEIETLLRSHPLVDEAVVTLRPDHMGEQQLVAYLVPARDAAQAAQLAREQTAQWEMVFDEAYTRDSGPEDPRLNFASWQSSYTGKPLPPEEMQEWVERTIVRLRRLRPGRVWEIGCGTGLLLLRLAPVCTFYLGTDASAEAIAFLQQQLARPPYRQPQVQVRQQTAESPPDCASGSFDLVILNSVIQYFPSLAYLETVLEMVLPLVQPGGHIFLGDVRNLLLQEPFHASVELAHAPASLSGPRLSQRIRQRMEQEEELLLHPAFFAALYRRYPQISQVRVELKRGEVHNEMLLFRYDATLTIGPRAARPAAAITTLAWQSLIWTPETLGQLLGAQAVPVCIQRIPNRRLQAALASVGPLPEAQTCGELRQRLRYREQAAADQLPDPEDLARLGEELGYEVELSWSAAAADGSYDAFFFPARPQAGPPPPLPPRDEQRLLAWQEYANDPLHGRLLAWLLPLLRAYLKEHLPAYMLPASLMLLRTLPTGPNGKLDRQALPEPIPPDPEREGAFTAPETPIQQTLARIWGEVLGLEKIGLHNNYFALGGDSIRSIQIVSRARSAGLQLTPRHLFQYQTIAALAEMATGLADAPPSSQTTEEFALPVALSVAPDEEAIDASELAALLAHRPDAQDIYPLSPMQEEMLAWCLHNPQPGLYVIHQVFPFDGIDLNIPAFTRAWQLVFARHPVLRTFFEWQPPASPRQIVRHPFAPSVEFFDLRTWTQEAQEQRLADYIEEQRRGGFDPRQTPQTHLALFHVAQDRYHFVWMFSYMLQDGWSFPLLMRDFFQAYTALCQGQTWQAEPLTAYRSFIAWLLRQDQKRAAAFWQRQLPPDSAGPWLSGSLPGERPDPGSYAYERQETMIPLSTTAGLQAMARQHQLTLNTLIQGAWALLLARVSGKEQVLFGSLASGRPASLPGIEEMVGFCNTILPVSARVASERDLLPWLKDLQARQAESRQYEYSTLTAIRQACAIPPDQALYESYLVFENFPFDRFVLHQLDAWQTGTITALAQTEHPLRIEIVPGQVLWIGMSYYLRCFSPGQITQLLQDFQEVLHAIATRPHQQLAAFLR
jgi:amino acid adenylation domain-containing protein